MAAVCLRAEPKVTPLLSVHHYLGAFPQPLELLMRHVFAEGYAVLLDHLGGLLLGLPLSPLRVVLLVFLPIHDVLFDWLLLLLLVLSLVRWLSLLMGLWLWSSLLRLVSTGERLKRCRFYLFKLLFNMLGPSLTHAQLHNLVNKFPHSVFEAFKILFSRKIIVMTFYFTHIKGQKVLPQVLNFMLQNLEICIAVLKVSHGELALVDILHFRMQLIQ